MGKISSQDRTRASVLIVVLNGTTSSQLRQALKSLGYAQLSVAPTHVAALERVKTRPFTHVIFDAKPSDMPPIEFVTQLLQLEAEAIMIAISEQPRIDDVFSLLRAGARHFIVPPFTAEVVEEVFTRSTDAPALSDAVLNAPDRNGAFTAVILNNLYRLSVSMRQSREFASAARDVLTYKCQLQESMELACLFCEGDENCLREKIIEGCINRAKDAATRLGRLRKRLSNSVCWLAGPPFVESVSQINAAASSLARLGGKFLRSRAYWPEAKDRDFQQHLISGLEVLRTAGLKHGLYVVSEIISPRDFALTAEYCDILEVHPELILNSAFMREAAKSGKTVMLPRHPMITVNQFIRVIKKFEDYGASRILLAENGARGHLSDQLFDLSAVVTLRLATAHPILVDCCRLTGSPSYAFNLAAAAITAGADGIIAEFENHGVRVKSYRGSLSAENIQEMMSRADALKHTLNALRHTHYAER